MSPSAVPRVVDGRRSIDPAAADTVVLFDLDGTVTDSFVGITTSFRHALIEIGEPLPPDDFWPSIVGPPLIDSLALLGITGDRAAAGVRAYRARYDVIGWRENAVFPGVAELLADLAAAGRTLAIATSKNEVIARRILEHFGLAHRFAHICGADDAVGRSAKGDVVAEALRRLGANPTERPIVMVGDRSHDVDGAASCQVPTIGVKWGYAHAGELEAAQHRSGSPEDNRWIVTTVTQLRKVLGV
ncbi:phosphoglycolate phosphatase [Gordonia malaquae]|uniref:Putative hydrolase n=1 Tax=Gordonia malaquae NBRC 108250 TaxID=1223542 RepID=M3TBH6_GORML|nr:HAD hydrolase-like protein [Gordonia malaquae]GAC78726.1 putative hydrolase [Gordonia malaquae NBRC 108250]SED62587.1 phosphoglycolate phosphatase [Gordonia malaquae]